MIKKAISEHKLYFSVLFFIVVVSLFLRLTENRIANWFSDEAEKHNGKQHVTRSYHK